MKNWLVFLLLLLTTAGTIIPCCGVDDCASDQLTATSTEDNHQPEGACSPFFACATCPGFADVSKPIELVQPEPMLPTHYPNAISLTLSSYVASLLQPPRNV